MKTIKHLIAAVSMALCLISLSVILTLNFKPLYYMDVKLMDLPEKTGYTEEDIKENYDALIEYNSVLYQGDLEFPTLSMSETGKIHFEEVKGVFMFFEAILFPITLLLSVVMIWFLRKEDALYLKWASYFMVGIPAVLGLLIAINWNRVFVLFHEIVFRNDYWIFDASTDPVITILPDEFFMHCALMILALVVLFSVICMLKYKGKKIRYWLLVCVLLAMPMLTGCTKDQIVLTDLEPYVGKYVAMTAKISDYQISIEEAIGDEMILKASGDGTVLFKVADKSVKGTWIVEKDEMILELAGETCYGKLEEDTVTFEYLYGIDAVIRFAKEGTAAMDPTLYYPEKELQVIGSWEAYCVEELIKEGVMTTMPGAETMAEAFTITFAENHMAEFVYMGETVKNIEWGFSLGDCYMDGGGYHLCAYPVENGELTVDIYNEDIWYTFHCKKAAGTEDNTGQNKTETSENDGLPGNSIANGGHSLYYNEKYSVNQVVEYFNDVVSGTEYSTGDGDSKLVQKWVEPIYYEIHGNAADEDLQVLEQLFSQLNEVEGFPGIYPVGEGQIANLKMSFYDREGLQTDFGEFLNYEEADGAVQYWYNTDLNDIYEGRIGFRTDISQEVRNGVLLEEVVNGLGIQDTLLREDSIVYQAYSDVQELSDMDWLLIRLLYHPDMKCGMTMDECRQVIERLYY